VTSGTADATSYQRLRERLAYLEMSTSTALVPLLDPSFVSRASAHPGGQLEGLAGRPGFEPGKEHTPYSLSRRALSPWRY